jgi:hypothetical protein
MRVPAKVFTLASRLRRRVSDSLPTTNPSGRAHGTSEHFLIDRQGIALVIVVAVLALVLTISALWIALRPI